MKLSNQNIASIVSEIDILRNSSHPNIIGFIEAYLKDRELWVYTSPEKNTPTVVFKITCRRTKQLMVILAFLSGCHGVYGQRLFGRYFGTI